MRSCPNPSPSPSPGPGPNPIPNPNPKQVLRFADDAQLREKVYRAHVTKASEFDDKDNAPTINRILTLRQERASLLGFSSHAEVDLTPSPSPNPNPNPNPSPCTHK